MKLLRTLIAPVAAIAAATTALPASAQFFFQPPDLRGAIVTGAEPGILAQALPGATPDELRAALIWNMRAGLNVAALQCQFMPPLLTLYNYNKILGDHGAELNASYATLSNYFVRVAPSKKAGQTALDQYGTRVYSSFSTVGAQLTFCQTAGEIANLAVFTPRGSFGTLAQERLRQLRNSLVLSGEQKFPWGIYVPRWTGPRWDKVCWKNENWVAKKCGAQTFG
ncbi:hypothetical protein M9980_01615 [Sphingomonas donggukensis]|uniref:Uncharacterized protein n=1 Tax=Sphingomonas donggukensis TaxID=2949093 RepID=A0ABY4TU82_9SPHN|nr:hypothetical protein [Sphingomonas donggukensis]URW75956.1 hypothetical protein M9980_01615 [Sphingomonas donggukensis]